SRGGDRAHRQRVAQATRCPNRASARDVSAPGSHRQRRLSAPQLSRAAGVERSANTCTRELSLSRTTRWLPASTSSAEELKNWPGPEPALPNASTNVPSRRNACTRELPASITTTNPFASTTIPVGDERWPGALP